MSEQEVQFLQEEQEIVYQVKEDPNELPSDVWTMCKCICTSRNCLPFEEEDWTFEEEQQEEQKDAEEVSKN